MPRPAALIPLRRSQRGYRRRWGIRPAWGYTPHWNLRRAVALPDVPTSRSARQLAIAPATIPARSFGAVDPRRRSHRAVRMVTREARYRSVSRVRQVRSGPRVRSPLHLYDARSTAPGANAPGGGQNTPVGAIRSRGATDHCRAALPLPGPRGRHRECASTLGALPQQD
jgi:hypothetical protein